MQLSRLSEDTSPIKANGDTTTAGEEATETDSNKKDECMDMHQDISIQSSAVVNACSPKPQAKDHIPQTLHYLERMCLRSRIQYLVNILKRSEVENVDLLQVFLDCIIKYDLERVRRIVRSAL